MLTTIIKRDGREVPFNVERITLAITNAMAESDRTDNQLAFAIAQAVRMKLEKSATTPTVEECQNLVEQELIRAQMPEIAKSYILFRASRTRKREMKSVTNKVIEDIVQLDAAKNDHKRENANVNGDAPMGAMLQIGGEAVKEFALQNLIKPKYSQEHRDGVIHIHDMNFLPLTQNCLYIPLGKLLENGFNTGHGTMRTPTTIGAASTLMCIVIQSSQNDFFGGQAIPNMDYDLAPYVGKSFVRNYINTATLLAKLKSVDVSNIDFKQDFIEPADRYIRKHERIMTKMGYLFLETKLGQLGITLTKVELANILDIATSTTQRDTYQAMEATIHNLCSLASRAGAQVPFSSVNFGTDTSTEGRIVIEQFLLATRAGLGAGETAIFPISIFRILKGTTDKGSPNYDLYKLACKVSSERLFPNFLNVSAPYNFQYYKPDHPETMVATMGCRTRVLGNTFDPNHAVTEGRGNLFFTTINLPYLALEAKYMKGDIVTNFYKRLDEVLQDVIDFSYDRFEIIARRKAKNYPFAFGQHEYCTSEKLKPNDEVREVIKQGSITAGFIGLAECLKVLTGKHHGESEASQILGLAIIGHMNDRMDKESEVSGLNFGLMMTPAEGCAGRLLRLTKDKFGTIEGVTDHEFLTNSSHVPVYYNIPAYRKIQIEAPYHAITLAGHIGYVEIDSDTAKNPEAFEQLVTYMADAGMGYFSINHPVDRCCVCSYAGVIDDVCPCCGRKNGEGVKLSELIKNPRFKLTPELISGTGLTEDELYQIIQKLRDEQDSSVD